jgi:CubicO group peptidase (beta-lactamase class C family)
MESERSFGDFASTREVIEADIAEGLFTRGAQICVSLDGEVVLDACMGEDGLGRAIRPDTIFRIYCSIKPVTAVAVANLVDSGRLDLDRPLAETLGRRPVLDGGLTARSLLNHTAGLHALKGVTMEMVPPGDRRTVVDRQHPPPGWRVGRDAGYSEYAAWNLLGDLLEAVSGQDLRHHLRGEVLDPLGMRNTWIGMTSTDYVAIVDRLGVNVDLRGFRSFPMLFERTERVCIDTNPAHGGYSTARDLVRMYDALLLAKRGHDVGGLPSTDTLEAFCTAARPTSYDVVLARECDYGLGFMVGLDSHFFGRDCSSLSFGHSGNVGSSFAFADPMHGLSVAVVLNGLVDHESAFVRRPRLVRSIYGDLGLRSQAEATEGPSTAQEGRFSKLRGAIRGGGRRQHAG